MSCAVVNDVGIWEIQTQCRQGSPTLPGLNGFCHTQVAFPAVPLLGTVHIVEFYEMEL